MYYVIVFESYFRLLLLPCLKHTHIDNRCNEDKDYMWCSINN